MRRLRARAPSRSHFAAQLSVGSKTEMVLAGVLREEGREARLPSRTHPLKLAVVHWLTTLLSSFIGSLVQFSQPSASNWRAESA